MDLKKIEKALNDGEIAVRRGNGWDCEDVEAITCKTGGWAFIDSVGRTVCPVDEDCWDLKEKYYESLEEN